MIFVTSQIAAADLLRGWLICVSRNIGEIVQARPNSAGKKNRAARQSGAARFVAWRATLLARAIAMPYVDQANSRSQIAFEGAAALSV